MSLISRSNVDLGFPFPSVSASTGLPVLSCEFNCGPGDPNAQKCKCSFNPPVTCCRAYGCDTCSIPLPKKPDDPNDPNQPDRPGVPPPAKTSDAVAKPDPDECEACVAYGLGRSVRSRLYCPRMMCEGGDEAVPKQCWLGGKCQKVSKEANEDWCQTPTNMPKRDFSGNRAEQQDNTPTAVDGKKNISLDPDMGIIGPVIMAPHRSPPLPQLRLLNLRLQSLLM